MKNERILGPYFCINLKGLGKANLKKNLWSVRFDYIILVDFLSDETCVLKCTV